MDKIQYENIVTPAGRAIYPWLIEPDTKFNTLGEYKVSLSLPMGKAEPLIKKIDEALQSLETRDYGYCEMCGVEIGVGRLEARPTATLCIDCKTLDEIKERQLG